MTRRVEFAHIETTLEDLSYPVLRHDAAADLEDVTLVLSDGETNLGVLVSETDSDAFQTPEDLLFELAESVGVPVAESREHTSDADGA
ncbi:DUF5789 family protein [Haloarchaeobius iranensis]|uniref:Uncharacterized protein n=1 Tax=Haloarchaeobius iranensis TaxID=996166 RepID=A0A1G9V340_9EURY|nr:hypothetical protein [Haloarchaeobius iranensis]SDM66558.1 hypothetical protein SAMN05192554_105164 [Haloarchaeobius iranensis]